MLLFEVPERQRAEPAHAQEIPVTVDIDDLFGRAHTDTFMGSPAGYDLS